MNIVYVDYEEPTDDEGKNSLFLSQKVNFDKNISTKIELLEHLYRWKPLSATIITVKNESGSIILTRKDWDDFFKGQEYTL